jgi:hypothetical protein
MNTQEIQEWSEEFDEKFDIPWGIDNSAGEYGLTFQGWDEVKSFISQKLKEQETLLEMQRIPVVRATQDYAIVSWGEISYKVFPNGNIIKL